MSGGNPADEPTDVRRLGPVERWQMVKVHVSDEMCPGVQAALRRTSQTVMAMSNTDNASSHPPSIHWNGQKWLAGW